MESLDVVVVGAGVVGLAVARAFARSGRDVTLIEAERDFGTGVSSRSSEVIHAGIYYPTGSLKARLCVRGKALLYAFCREREIPCRQLGKLIVATSEGERSTLARYKTQAVRNGVTDLEMLTPEQLRDLEPEVEAVDALLSPSTGIVDARAMMFGLLAEFESAGGTVVYDSRVSAGRLTDAGPQFELDEDGPFSCRLLVNAAGLGAQALARALGLSDEHVPKLHYAKGHYFSWSGPVPFRRLVYPVASNAGLGIHATLDLGGQLRFGPDVSWTASLDYAFEEERRAGFAREIRRYFPACDESRLRPGYTGIRPKLVSEGEPSSDFRIQGEEEHGAPGLINLFGIESPGLTSSMAIAEHLVEVAA